MRGLPLFLFLTLTASSPAAAQPADAAAGDPWSNVEEMIVTGSPTAALLNPATASAITFDTESLQARGIEDVSDVAAFVPNLEISSQNATNASFFVRGVGLQDFGANASSAVPIIQDGIVRNPSATQLVGLFDIGGLSVGRGPQGSGNARNASAGAIRIQTVMPEPEFSGYAQATLAQISSVDAFDAPRYNFEAAVSAPVYQDIVSVRLSARYSAESAFVENNCANRTPLEGRAEAQYRGDPSARICVTIEGEDFQGRPLALDGESVSIGESSDVPAFLDKRIGDVDDFGFRGQIRVNPPDQGWDVVFRVETSNLTRDSTVGAHIGTARFLGGFDDGGYRDPEITTRFNRLIDSGLSIDEAERRIAFKIVQDRGDTRPFTGGFDQQGKTLVETLTTSMTLKNEFENFDLEWNVGFLDYRKSERRDTDLTPNLRFPTANNDQAWEFYTDGTLSGEAIASLPVVWKVGAYTLLENVEATQRQFLFGAQDRINKFDQEIYSFGIFAEAEYEFLEAITLAGGIRYNWERKGFEVSELRITNQIFRELIDSENQLTWDAPTGFVEFRYDFTEDIASYVRYSRGFKAGHFNPSRPDSAGLAGVGFADPERIDSVEWGVEFAGWDGRLSGNGAFFFYNYRNYQVFRLTSTFGGVFREIQNAEKARNIGAELSLALRPLEGFAPPAIDQLQLSVDAGWLDTEFIDFVNFDQRQFDGGAQLTIQIDNSGNPLINAPEFNVVFSLIWPIISANLGTLTPQYDLTWTDDVPFDPNRGRGQRDLFGASRYPPYVIGNRAYALHNVRLTYEPPNVEGLRISGWCRNVTDQRYDNFSVDLTNFALQQLRFPSEPRTCGVDMRFSW